MPLNVRTTRRHVDESWGRDETTSRISSAPVRFHELVLTSTEMVGRRRFETADLASADVSVFRLFFAKYGHDRFLAEVPIDEESILEFHWRREHDGRRAVAQFYCRGAMLFSAFLLKEGAVVSNEFLRSTLASVHEQAGGRGHVLDVDLLPQPRPLVIAVPFPHPRCLDALESVGWLTRCLMAAFLELPVPSR